MNETEKKFCKCGCGQPIPHRPGAGRQRLFLPGHKTKTTKPCKCGCGVIVPFYKQYVPGHSPALRDNLADIRAQWVIAEAEVIRLRGLLAQSGIEIK